jgi:9-cis-epoxycarotenoid dioxygenase
MRWFPVPGFNAMHVTNAWENGDDEVVLVAGFVLNIENVFQKIEKVHFSLEKLTINMRTGKALKKILSKRSLELGSINASYVGKNNRYAYLGIAEKIPKM